MKPPGNFPLHKDRESFIKPEMLEIAISHQIAGPTVGDFMGNYIDKRTVSSLRKNHKINSLVSYDNHDTLLFTRYQ